MKSKKLFLKPDINLSHPSTSVGKWKKKKKFRQESLVVRKFWTQKDRYSAYRTNQTNDTISIQNLQSSKFFNDIYYVNSGRFV